MGANIGTEPELWDLARNGDAHAFGYIYDAHRHAVFGHAYALLLSVHDAEDATAVVFLELWRKRDQVPGASGSLDNWLAGATTNVVRNIVRSKRRYRALLAKIPRDDQVVVDHADYVVSGVEAARLREVIGQLAVRDREVVMLCLLEGLTMAEAAGRLGVPLGTVKSRLARARKRLSADLRG